jgi:hypothetical protein
VMTLMPSMQLIKDFEVLILSRFWMFDEIEKTLDNSE